MAEIGNFTYGMADCQGKIAMDGDFRSHKAGCRRLRPVRFEIPPHPPPPIPASRT
ncbi:MAG: hypothetical protein K2N15_03575 [Lachnospiraceae bacterium]|nr:hypothetical protein [Lachnospiraceae bacterium]